MPGWLIGVFPSCWDGSGEFLHGEVDDFKLYLLERFDVGTSMWMEVSPPLLNASLALPKDALIPRQILRIRYESIHDLPPP